MSSLKSVILAGGVGTRLWPLSRTYQPKQFLKIEGYSLFQETFLRALRLCAPGDIIIVTNEVHQYLVMNQIEELGHILSEYQVLKEPVGKNTLPAITWAMSEIRKRFGESDVVIFPSDHKLGDSATDEIKAAAGIASDYLVLFGIPPTHPNTGYGYIAQGAPLATGYRVLEFKEKPDLPTAEQYLASGYLWNSGMFYFRRSCSFWSLRSISRNFIRHLKTISPITRTSHPCPLIMAFLKNPDRWQ
jgi:mannose-1-phosphate guanylyltransferase/mannose-6-phosphate isomerase